MKSCQIIIEATFANEFQSEVHSIGLLAAIKAFQNNMEKSNKKNVSKVTIKREERKKGEQED